MAGGSVNKVILIGNLGADPELRRTPGGAAVTNFSIATTRRFKDREGQFRENTEWHNIVAWNRSAEVMCQYLRKGSKVYIEGALQTRSWESDGVRKYRTEINVREFNFLDSKPAGGGGNYGGQQQNQGYAPQQGQGNYGGGQPAAPQSSYDQGPDYGGQSYGGSSADSMPSQPSDMPVDDDLPF
ncbi:MAG: single-stranded DNA-binding protein [Fibrobacterota bacterium]